MKRRPRHPLGPFSYLIMRTLSQLPADHCYCSYLELHLRQVFKDRIDLTQIFIASKRLAARGYIKGTPAKSPTGANRTVMLYSITDAGSAILKEAAVFYSAITSLDPE